MTDPAPIQLPTPPATPAPTVSTPAPSAAQKIENTVFAFLQAHYAKVLAAVVGFLTSHFGLLGKFL